MTPLEALDRLRRQAVDAEITLSGMAAASELAAIVRQALLDGPRPLVVTTAAELDALPAGTVLRDRYGTVWEVMDQEDEDYRFMAPTADPYFQPESLARHAPLTVIWTPPQPDPTTDPSRPTGA